MFLCCAIGSSIEELPCPPAVLEETRAICMRRAMELRVPSAVWGRDGAHARGLVLSSDSAQPCKLLAKLVRASCEDDAGLFVAHARCQMHMFWAGAMR